MAKLIIYLVAAFFLMMGIIGIWRPQRLMRWVAVTDMPPELRNEVRAVYGGYGIAIALALFVATRLDGLRLGVLFTVATSLMGMACGRIASLVVERPSGKSPYIFLFMELGLSLALCYSWWNY